MARHTDRPRSALPFDPDFDRPDETPELDQRLAGLTPVDHLEALRQALRVYSPVLHVRLITTGPGAPYLHTARGKRDERLSWDEHASCYRWESSSETPGTRADVDATAHTVATIMGAPIRTF